MDKNFSKINEFLELVKNEKDCSFYVDNTSFLSLGFIDYKTRVTFATSSLIQKKRKEIKQNHMFFYYHDYEEFMKDLRRHINKEDFEELHKEIDECTGCVKKEICTGKLNCDGEVNEN